MYNRHVKLAAHVTLTNMNKTQRLQLIWTTIQLYKIKKSDIRCLNENQIAISYFYVTNILFHFQKLFNLFAKHAIFGITYLCAQLFSHIK
jgi:hypothetical protein